MTWIASLSSMSVIRANAGIQSDFNRAGVYAGKGGWILACDAPGQNDDT
jgi:hypothetical protein